MALNIVNSPASYYPDFNTGRPVFNGDIFVGEPDTDPEILGNQKQITLRQEDGTEVPVSQPVKTSSGGVPTFNGGRVDILVDGNYSIKVLNKQGSQVYFVENAFNGEPLVEGADSSLITYDPPFTGSTPTTVEGKLSESVSVKDFGALGDGITDDTAAFLSAMTSSVQVYAPPGTYILDNLVPVQANRLILDEAATLKHKDASTSDMIVTAFDLTIEGGTLDGNKANITQRNKAVLHSTSGELIVKSSTFNNSIFNAISITGTPTFAHIDECTIKNMAEHSGVFNETTMAILVRGDTGSSPVVWITNNTITHGSPTSPGKSPGGIIVDGDAAESLQITGNFFDNIGQDFVSNFIGNVDLYTNSNSTIVSNNRVKNWFFQPFKIQNSNNVLVTNNICDTNAGTGTAAAINVQNARDIGSVFSNSIISNNIIKDAGTGFGITIFGDAGNDDFWDRVVCSNNILENVNRGIEVKAASSIYLVDNILDNVTQQGVLISNVSNGAGAPTNAICIIKGGELRNCGGAGVSASTNVTNLHLGIEGVTFESNTADHIRIDNAVMVSLADNIFVDDPGSIIDLRSNTDIQVVGNVGPNGAVTTFSANTRQVIVGNSWQVPQTYTITNVTTDRTYNADSTTTAELADALGTLIADLRTQGLVL